MLKKILVGFLAVVVVCAVALWGIWPKNLVVRGPMFDFITGAQVPTPDAQMLANRFKLPDGFRIGLYAEKVENARMMAFSPTGDLAVSSKTGGEVILLWGDENGDGRSDGREVLLSGLKIPHGLAFWNGYLYVAETHRIIRAKYDSKTHVLGEVEIIFEGLPSGGNHNTRTIGFGPDGWLYVTVGSSCNVCIEDHPYRAAMLRMKPDGTGARAYATGLRNTVGFDWQPGTGNLFGTDNGRDLLGDDTPNCELNMIEEGAFYGWPYTYDDRVIDPDMGSGHEGEIAASHVMAHGLGAHVAPLGIRFLNPEMAPEGYENAALVALHGSWNRSELSGYKVVSLHFGADGTIEERDFLTGFEVNEDVIGRPVDMVQGAEGAIYISDDYSGSIYRVVWGDMDAGSLSRSAKAAKGDPLAAYTDIDISLMRAKGAALYEAHNCKGCHETEAASVEPSNLKVLKDLSARYDVEGLKTILDIPPGPMPRADITDADREALAVLLLSRERERKVQSPQSVD